MSKRQEPVRGRVELVFGNREVKCPFRQHRSSCISSDMVTEAERR